MAHLAGEPVEEHVLDAIKEYEERLKKRLDDNDVKDKELATRVEEYNSTWEGEEEGPSIVRDEIMEKVACLPASSYSAKPIRILFFIDWVPCQNSGSLSISDITFHTLSNVAVTSLLV